MNPWYAKTVVLVTTVVLIAIRAPHGKRSRDAKVAGDYRDALEKILLTINLLGFFLPLLWVFSPLFAFAEYSLRWEPLVAGIVCHILGLWIFMRSHRDLGVNWSVTLQVREQHTLVTQGVYRRIRHPMYSALFLYCIAQALVIPNWFVGPSYLVAFTALFVHRIGLEERMMIDRFGDEYRAYMKATKRLVPGVW